MFRHLRFSRRLPALVSRRWRCLAAVPIAASVLVPMITGVVPGRATTSASSVAQLKIMNYYPANAGWGQMWVNWQPSVIAADFSRIASLNANTVRLIVQTSAFGYPSPSVTMKKELAQGVSMAANAGLKVQLTLFDGFTSYADISGSEQWASQLLSGYKGDSRIAFIEVQNEVDPSVSAQMTWAQQLIPYVRSRSGSTPVTVSVCGCDNAADLAALKSALGSVAPDFWDFHYYGGSNPDVAGVSIPAALTVLLQAQQIAAPLPLIIGETGYSTLASNAAVLGLPQIQGAQEAFQQQFYSTVAFAARKANLPVPAPWILNDFTSTGCICAEVERHFGLYRTDGSAKPAVATIAGIFAGNPIDTSLNNGFELAAGLPNVPSNWRVYGYGYGTFARDTTTAHSGAASASLSQTTALQNGSAPCWFEMTTTPPIVGQQYTLSAYVGYNQTTGGTTTVNLAWWDAAGHYVGSASAILSPTTTSTATQWTLVSATGTVPSGAAQAEIALCSKQNSGTVWFDDVSLQ